MSNEDMWIERRPDDPAFTVHDLVQHTDGREGEVTFVGNQVVVKFDEEPHKRYFAWNLAVAQLTKVGTVAQDPNELWLKAGV